MYIGFVKLKGSDLNMKVRFEKEPISDVNTRFFLFEKFYESVGEPHLYFINTDLILYLEYWKEK